MHIRSSELLDFRVLTLLKTTTNHYTRKTFLNDAYSLLRLMDIINTIKILYNSMFEFYFKSFKTHHR